MTKKDDEKVFSTPTGEIGDYISQEARAQTKLKFICHEPHNPNAI
jgi:hypothetical protein